MMAVDIPTVLDLDLDTSGESTGADDTNGSTADEAA